MSLGLDLLGEALRGKVEAGQPAQLGEMRRWLSWLEEPFATAEELATQFGPRNWVLARRSQRIIDKYGPDVRCVSGREYSQAQARALMAR